MFPLKCGPVVGLSALTGGSEEVHVVAVFMERAVVLSCLCVCVCVCVLGLQAWNLHQKQRKTSCLASRRKACTLSALVAALSEASGWLGVDSSFGEM